MVEPTTTANSAPRVKTVLRNSMVTAYAPSVAAATRRTARTEVPWMSSTTRASGSMSRERASR